MVRSDPQRRTSKNFSEIWPMTCQLANYRPIFASTADSLRQAVDRQLWQGSVRSVEQIRSQMTAWNPRKSVHTLIDSLAL